MALSSFDQLDPFFYHSLHCCETNETFYSYSLIFSAKATEFEHKPLILTLWSSVYSPNNFEQILLFIHRIFQVNAQTTQDKLHLYKNVEILRSFAFLTKIIFPPANSSLSIDLPNERIKFEIQPFNQLPRFDASLEVVLRKLETDTIVKLWTCLLQERSLIIITSNPNLLFYIITGLLALIFPFTWIHTCINAINNKNMHLLNSNKPYIIGVTQNIMDKETARIKYPTSTILDLETGNLYNHSHETVPFIERAKLKRKLTVAI